MKWIDVFSTSDQFSSLSNQKLEGIEQLMNQFHRIKQDLKSKKHDLLDYQNNKFDRDFVELNVQIADLESSLHQIYFQPQIPWTSCTNSKIFYNAYHLKLILIPSLISCCKTMDSN